MQLMSKIRGKVEGGKAVLRLFERGVLIFPVGVTMLVGVALLGGGGGISAWQWWLPVCGVLLLTLLTRREPLSRRVCACGLFLLLLVGVWFCAGLIANGETSDASRYHLPIIRLLAEGWNPVYANTPDTLAQTMSIDPSEMWRWHVLFLSKGVHYFSAVAYSFVRDPFSIFTALCPFLFIATCGQLWRLLRQTHLALRILSIVLLFFLAPSIIAPVDCVVGLAGIGLLCAMTRRLNREPGTLLPLLCMSFWMITAKQLGLLSCFVFWVCFSAVLLWREKWTAVPYLAKMAGALLVAFCIVCASPYLTSWKHYGHPLYPAYTVDEAKFPVHDITADFLDCNEDARAMGHIGAFVYTYISPTLGRFYYNWKLGKTNFAPHRHTWGQYVKEEMATVPIPTSVRWQLLLSFALVAVLGGRRLRFVWCTTALALFCFPTAYLGYLRYTPWLAGVQVLALCCLGASMVDFIQKQRYWRAAICGVVALGLLSVCLRETGWSAFCIALAVDERQKINTYFDATSEHAEKAFYVDAERNTIERRSIANLHLLCRQLAPSYDVSVHYLTPTEAKDAPYVVQSEVRLPYSIVGVCSEFDKIQMLPARKARFMRYPLFILKTYTVTLPKLVWARVKSVFA